MFIAELFLIAKTWKQPKCPWTNEMDKQNVVYTYHTMKCYSALKRKEVLTYATMWMNLEAIMLSEISQSQKDKYCMILLT